MKVSSLERGKLGEKDARVNSDFPNRLGDGYNPNRLSELASATRQK